MKKCISCLLEKELSAFDIYHYKFKKYHYIYVRKECRDCYLYRKREEYKLSYKPKSKKPKLIPGENWKQIPGFKDYFVSNLGRVKRNNKQIIKPEKTNRGYYRITLCNNNSTTRKSIHRLVAISFIKNPANKPHVNHINGIKKDNRSENLEWVTQSENQIHAFKTGLQKSKKYATI